MIYIYYCLFTIKSTNTDKKKGLNWLIMTKSMKITKHSYFSKPQMPGWEFDWLEET